MGKGTSAIQFSLTKKKKYDNHSSREYSAKATKNNGKMFGKN